MSKRIFGGIVGASAVLLFSGAANAIPISYVATAVAESPNATADVAVGDTLSLSFVYDFEPAVSNSSGPGMLVYVGAVSGLALSSQTSFSLYGGTNATLIVADENFFSYSGVSLTFGVSVDGGLTRIGSLYLNLPYDTNSTFAPAQLPAFAGLNPAELGHSGPYTEVGFVYQPSLWSRENPGIHFALSSLTAPTSVPEPATLGLFALGIVGAGWARRRRRT